jgi:hypothetical protein
MIPKEHQYSWLEEGESVGETRKTQQTGYLDNLMFFTTAHVNHLGGLKLMMCPPPPYCPQGFSRSYHVTQAGLELLDCSSPPASVS